MANPKEVWLTRNSGEQQQMGEGRKMGTAGHHQNMMMIIIIVVIMNIINPLIIKKKYTRAHLVSPSKTPKLSWSGMRVIAMSTGGFSSGNTQMI